MRFSFSDQYSKTTIKEQCCFVKDGTHGTHKDYVGGIPLLSAKDIHDGEIDLTNNPRTISEKDYCSIYKKQKPAINDILITIVGSIGRTALVTDISTKFAFQRSVGWLRPKDSILPLYFKYLLLSETVQKQLSNKTNASAQGGIYLGTLENLSINLPHKEEQAKVARFLSKIEERIKTQNKIIEKYKSLIKQINDDIFSGEKNCPIGDYIRESSARNKDGSVFNVLSVNNKNGFVKQSEQFEDKELASEDKTNYKIVKKGDFAYNPARINVGSIALLKNHDVGIISPMYICFKTVNVSDEVLESYFASSSFEKEMNKRLEGSVRMCLTIDGLKNIHFHMPSETEKRALSYLVKLKDFVEINKNILKLYNQQKSYLLSNLFI